MFISNFVIQITWKGGQDTLTLWNGGQDTLTVENSGQDTLTVSRGEIYTRNFGVGMRTNASIENKGILVTSDKDIAVQGVNVVEFSTDAFQAVPVTSKSTYFFIPSYLPSSQIVAMATEDDTQVNVYAQDDLVLISSLTLNKYQTYHMYERFGDYTGAFVTSTKPVAVFSGNRCVNVPRAKKSCDHLVDGVPPIAELGKEYIVPPIAGRKAGYAVRVISARDNTTVNAYGLSHSYGSQDLEAGDFWEFEAKRSLSSIRIKCSEPCMVSQYNKGQTVDNIATDPFMTLVSPTFAYRNNYIWNSIARGGNENFRHYASVITRLGR